MNEKLSRIAELHLQLPPLNNASTNEQFAHFRKARKQIFDSIHEACKDGDVGLSGISTLCQMGYAPVVVNSMPTLSDQEAMTIVTSTEDRLEPPLWSKVAQLLGHTLPRELVLEALKRQAMDLLVLDSDEQNRFVVVDQGVISINQDREIVEKLITQDPIEVMDASAIELDPDSVRHLIGILNEKSVGYGSMKAVETGRVLILPVDEIVRQIDSNSLRLLTLIIGRGKSLPDGLEPHIIQMVTRMLGQHDTILKQFVQAYNNTNGSKIDQQADAITVFKALASATNITQLFDEQSILEGSSRSARLKQVKISDLLFE
jgi:hypothetical protein